MAHHFIKGHHAFCCSLTLTHSRSSCKRCSLRRYLPVYSLACSSADERYCSVTCDGYRWEKDECIGECVFFKQLTIWHRSGEDINQLTLLLPCFQRVASCLRDSARTTCWAHANLASCFRREARVNSNAPAMPSKRAVQPSNTSAVLRERC